MRKKIGVPFIGVRLHENRTPTGRRTQTPAKRAALYVAYGSGRTPAGKEARLTGSQRGEWLSPDGRVQPHDEVMAWLRAESFRHRYTFETLLSVRDGDLTGEAFCKAMGQGEAVSDWRLMMHNDTNNSHAHVLFFGDKRMDKKAFLAWQADVRTELVAQEKLHPDVVRPRHPERGRSTFDKLSTSLFDRGSLDPFGKLKRGVVNSSVSDKLVVDTAIDVAQIDESLLKEATQAADPALSLSTSSRDPLSTSSRDPLSASSRGPLSKGWGMGL